MRINFARLVTGFFDGRQQRVGIGDTPYRGTLGRQVDGSLFNAGHRFECTFNATHARGARHALNRQFDDGGFFLFFQR